MIETSLSLQIRALLERLPLELWLLGVLAFALWVAWLALRLRRARAARALRLRAKRGREGETRAQEVLEAHGYSILDDQVTIETGLWLDEVWQPFRVRADFLVAREGARYVVEVKTGQVAPDPRAAATRRQLLEYSLAFRCDGLLLADMESETLHAVRFPRAGERERSRRRARGWQLPLWTFGLGLLAGAGLMWWRGG